MRKVLDQIYEQKFYDFSYGFRKGRSCHQAVRVINQTVMTKKVNWVHLPSDFTSRRTPLVFGCILPAAGRIWDFHPLETCAARRTTTKSAALNREGSWPRLFFTYVFTYVSTAVRVTAA
jgi:hypothetical protein